MVTRNVIFFFYLSAFDPNNRCNFFKFDTILKYFFKLNFFLPVKTVTCLQFFSILSVLNDFYLTDILFFFSQGRFYSYSFLSYLILFYRQLLHWKPSCLSKQFYNTNLISFFFQNILNSIYKKFKSKQLFSFLCITYLLKIVYHFK